MITQKKNTTSTATATSDIDTRNNEIDNEIEAYEIFMRRADALRALIGIVDYDFLNREGRKWYTWYDTHATTPLSTLPLPIGDYCAENRIDTIPLFGKLVKKAWRQAHGRDPIKASDGYVYHETDRPIFDQIRDEYFNKP